MGDKKEFGLIGKNISYSFSKKYFGEKFQKLLLHDCQYTLFDIPQIEDFSRISALENLVGLNVTIPYKTAIIPLLDELSEEATAIGAVNCIHFSEGKKKGYNTDAFGFEKTLLIHKKPHHQSALILGNGGAAKAVKYVLDKHQITYQTVARNTNLHFDNLSKRLVQQHLLIIQTTPVGTFPNIESCVDFPFDALGANHLVIDLIYNPNVTTFLKLAAQQNAKTMNGYYMLEQQAEKSWQIWNKSQF